MSTKHKATTKKLGSVVGVRVRDKDYEQSTERRKEKELDKSQATNRFRYLYQVLKVPNGLYSRNLGWVHLYLNLVLNL
jgi:hypothetical protein